MSSYFPFSSSSSSLVIPASNVNLDDPHLEVTVTPSASAYYAGETFSVTITFRNTRIPSTDAQHPRTPATGTSAVDVRSAVSALRQLPPFDPRTSAPVQQPQFPQRRNQIGLNLPPVPLHPAESSSATSVNAEAGPSRARTPLSITSTPVVAPGGLDANYPYSPGANPSYRAPGWTGSRPGSPTREGTMNFRSPDGWGRKENGGKEIGHSRRSRSLALGKGTMSPQELVWALGGQPTPPPLPTRRRPGGPNIPSTHPHSRKISITNPLNPQNSGESSSVSSPPLNPVPERWPSNDAAPSRPTTQTTPSYSSASTSASQSFTTLNEESETLAQRPLPHSRTPSYYNAYGASFLGLGDQSQAPTPPPPTHPYIRDRLPTEPRGTTTILWAYTRLVAHFHPSNSYIPPDPLLPLRSLLLHQPVGSGSLLTSTSASSNTSHAPSNSSSRWQLSFGTGTIGNATQPSLTGSLFGLAKELVMGGGGGSLEEERKRVWNMKDLPVLETTRSLLGVDLKLKEGESREFTYTLPLPTTLPPAHRGKAFRFSYDFVVSLTVALPGGGHRQKTKDISVPIRVWANVSVGHPFRTYDVLRPVIQTKEEGNVQEAEDIDEVQSPLPPQEDHSTNMARRRSSTAERHRAKTGDTMDSLQVYARHLLDTLDINSGSDKSSPRTAPLSPSRARPARSRVVSPSSAAFELPPTSPLSRGERERTNSELLEVPLNGTPVGKTGRGFKPRAGTIVDGDDELVEELGDEGSCGEAVEILSRHSPKSSYDISKDGEVVAVLTLIKTTYRLGETVLGVVTFNDPHTDRRVLKFSAFLESHELIPEPLLPPPSTSGPPKQPPLGRLHAEHHSSYALSASRIAFSLDIPSDATPAFSLAAGQGGKGGLEWRVKLSFTVAVPPHQHQHHSKQTQMRNGQQGRKSLSDRDRDGKKRNEAVHLLPSSSLSSTTSGDTDNKFYSASETMSPLLPYPSPGGGQGEKMMRGGGWHEMRTEVVECEVPVKVLAGNTAFVVRPSVYVI
ncbi:hypothetical protein CI109_100331 [Kwoniella shandongensis]|uniref:Uncharacterized protein n=1 Tax=Kwoniella shandongensis TaxID=1734106 RepID=A0A5M6C4I2_9TREE|nr:uncharacterized protein CI109_001823 [Kwoniella shandongensis]KAA5529883.1 hypothetical protein CI109_001823 [Kwoniella shandongensis]